MSDFDRWLPPVTQFRLAEFEEMLVVTFQSPGPPHHILSFCHNCVGGEPPQQVAKEFASLGREVPLSKVAQIFSGSLFGRLDSIRNAFPTDEAAFGQIAANAGQGDGC